MVPEHQYSIPCVNKAGVKTWIYWCSFKKDKQNEICNGEQLCDSFTQFCKINIESDFNQTHKEWNEMKVSTMEPN